ncbi:PREDICTED: uncharacterized protein LOC105364794 [Ceratosolen solmsi marchali]|uniref:Uncharacterized protein LOC105364794 n=1 Tax=Ceratosolen solmsi marchali TaxID=326594 RepID=A0AAJ6YN34_9HYME|nr:PREDICTED: uncharacterized protein LOC105364794 [Ceratosolen solmsi marchali]
MANIFMPKQWINIIWLVTIINLDSFNTVKGNKKVEKQVTPSIPNVRKYLCCVRQKKMIDVGHGISGEVIQIDTGYCKSFCHRHFVDDSGDLSRPAIQKCMPNTQCRPRTARLDRISTIEGVKTIEVIDSCDCSTGQKCRRDVYSQILYMGTPYQVEIDVGICVGRCKKFHCRPTKNSSVSIHGPNGDEVHQVIERCSCTGSCHRMDRVETILDFSGIEIKEDMNIAEAKPILRQINIGQCVGECSGNTTETCILRDKKNPTKCLAAVYSKNQNCIAVKFKVHEYRTRRGMKRDIIQILQCACV